MGRSSSAPHAPPQLPSSPQRWVRDPRWKGKSITTVKPLSGGSYTVWPVMHGYLTGKKLQTVDVDEVRHGEGLGSLPLQPCLL